MGSAPAVRALRSRPGAEVIRLANQSQGCLGKFASVDYKDSRAPQNLYPIGGLERELRHRLGDPKLCCTGRCGKRPGANSPRRAEGGGGGHDVPLYLLKLSKKGSAAEQVEALARAG